MGEKERALVGTVTSPDDDLYGTISTFSMPMKSGKTVQFKVDEHGNITVWEWDTQKRRWDKVWGRLIHMPKEE